jgi:hypothetical protein
MQDTQFMYRNHQCHIEFDRDPECVKAWHWVTKPTGERVLADISPYDWRESTVRLWIDAHYLSGGPSATTS